LWLSLSGMIKKRASHTTARLAAGQVVMWGAFYYAFAVLMPTMSEDLAWSPALLSAGFSAGLLVSGLLAPRIGDQVDRAGGQGVMTGGSVVGSIGLVLWAVASHPAMYLGAWLIIGVAMAKTLYEPAFATVVRENPERHRTAIVVIGMVGALASPLFTPATAWAVDRLGWRGALLGLAAIVAATGFLHSRLPSDRAPLSRLLPPSGRAPPERARDEYLSAAAPDILESETRLMGIGIAVAAGVATAANTHLIAILLQIGHPMERAVGLVAAIGFAKIVGRGLVLLLPEHLAPRRRISLALTLQAVGLAAALTTSPLVLGLPLLFGAASGAMTVLKPIELASLGHPQSFAKRSGRIQRTTVLVKSAAPLLLGAGVTWIESYQVLWWLLPVSLIMTAAVIGSRRARPLRIGC
jgi:MFS family permease